VNTSSETRLLELVQAEAAALAAVFSTSNVPVVPQDHLHGTT
jgi:hypothetical protein